MTAAGWALLGVGVGAIIPALTTLYQVRKSAQQADKDRAATTTHAEQDRQEARDDRLFDLRREAYVEFQAQARRTLDYLWRSDELGDVPPPDFDVFDPALEKESMVQLFGTEAAANAARAVIDALHAYDGRTEKNTYGKVNEAIAEFARVGRADLGAKG